MTGLFALEFRKRYESLKWPALGLVLLTLALAAVAGLTATAEVAPGEPTGRAGSGVLFWALQVLSGFIWFYPLADAVWRFHADLAGRHAPLELGIARPAWQKVLAKVTASLVLFLLSSLVVVLIGFVRLWAVRQLPDAAEAGPPELLGMLAMGALGLVLLACAAGYHALKHRTRWAAPAAIATFVGIVWLLMTAISSVDDAGNTFTPLADRLLPFGSLVVSATVAVVGFAAASWLYDRAEI